MDEVTAFEGVLTGTTTFVLDEMAKGVSFDDAVRSAQEEGIAEPDPTVDVGGWDTAAKVVILANTLWNTHRSISDVDVTGLSEDVQPVREGRPTRVVGRARDAMGARLSSRCHWPRITRSRPSRDAIRGSCSSALRSDM